ncbi:NGFI-A-binding protein homolog [Drosophila rhopaloa]|uniref:NGFI-A-binding protein homolog n=2 Tax=Drosophila rhopaloa TaxID=1041015 RepID=A0ABM5J4L9_DRORH|nr:NGFI-A-binding protein homolog [Drosophila rhopaloa]
MEASSNPTTPTTAVATTTSTSSPSSAASTSSKGHSQAASSCSASASVSASASASATQSQLLTTSLEMAKAEDLYNLSLASGLSEGQRSLSGAPSASSSPIMSPQGKIFGRNANGTMITTSRPGNEAEVQLYRVLQRASLLAYYDTLLEMGGDDVQQLYDAGEEEFLEIMALVGMASKPLHVRRLQKALHEWANNPGLFQGPLLPHLGLCETPPKPALVFNPDTTPALPRQKFPSFNPSGSSFQPSPVPPAPLPTSGSVPASTAPLITQISCPSALPSVPMPLVLPSTPLTSSPHPSGNSCLPASTAAHQVSSSSPQLTPVLTEMQIQRITMCADKIGRQLPQREPRAQTTRKRTTRELEQVIAMGEQDPRRMDEIRKYSAIYGRFDCKRRPEKPLTLHEVCVNEAAAQLCRNPQTIWLLTRRDELFPLARQIVKDAGFGHSASIARYGGLLTQLPSQGAGLGGGRGPGETDCESSDAAAVPPKRQRLSSTEAAQLPLDLNREAVEDSRYNLFAMYQKFAKPPFDLTEIAKFSLGKAADYEDNDSRFSFSNSSSPTMPTPCNGMESERSPSSLHMEASSPPRESVDLSAASSNPALSGVQVISAAGDNIIAVANPALALSPTLNEVLSLKRNAASPEA